MHGDVRYVVAQLRHAGHTIRIARDCVVIGGHARERILAMGWAERAERERKARKPLIEQPGAILVVSGDRTTYPQFARNIAVVVTTPGTRLHWYMAGGGQLAEARNSLVRGALEAGAAWAWFMDDDHVFPADVVARLLGHDVDIVVPAVCQRFPPHLLIAPALFPISADVGDHELIETTRGATFPQVETPQSERLVEIGWCGTGGMLVATRVLRAMPDPWFEFGRLPVGGDDVWFALKARRLGFKIFCDLDTPIGHLNTVAAWPLRDPKTGKIEPQLEFGMPERLVSHVPSAALVSNT